MAATTSSESDDDIFLPPPGLSDETDVRQGKHPEVATNVDADAVPANVDSSLAHDLTLKPMTQDVASTQPHVLATASPKNVRFDERE